MDTLMAKMAKMGKILDRFIKITMVCVGVLGTSQRGKICWILVFLKVKIIGEKGVIFVQIFTVFYCLFVASLGSKKGIKSPVMKHQKRNKIGILEGGKMYKNV